MEMNGSAERNSSDPTVTKTKTKTKTKKRRLLTISRKPCEEETDHSEGGATVVVGMKLDSRSRELLTWALVKVANSGDRVVALHVIGNSEGSNGQGNAPLVSLVKAFDSLLTVYQGFCNLKQLDLKLKICRGYSARKVLVREAKAYFASKLVVGTSSTHHRIGLLSASVARYCSRNLSKDFCVVAVNNGKVVFQREANGVSRLTTSTSRGVDNDEYPRKSLFGSIHWKSSKSPKVINNVASNREDSGNSHSKACSRQQKCPISSPLSVPLHSHCTNSTQEAIGEVTKVKSLAIVPVQAPEASPRPVSLLIQEFPELRSDSSLHQDMSSNQKLYKRSSAKEVSVFRWAVWFPSRYCSTTVHPCRQLNLLDHKKDCITSLDEESGVIVPQLNLHDQKKDCVTRLDEESGAIVLVEDNPDPLASINHDSENICQKDYTSNLDENSGAIVLVGNTPNPPASPDHGSNNLPKELEYFHEKYSLTCRLFGYYELLSATSNFLPNKLVGSGGSSYVYKGCLPDGKELAVKILKPSENVVREFISEIEIITTLNHKNIVSLFGFCFEDFNLLLVYDFLSRGSLEENLHGNKKDTAMFGWGERYKVALGVADALDYLHNRSAKSVIHRDVKSSNILLSDEFEPQLADFGFAKWASASTSHIVCTDVAGTFGYLAPEYFLHGKLNDKVDVYAFGIVLLELLSGRKPVNNEYPKGQESLVMWAKPILNGGKVTQLLDPSFGDDYDCEQIERMVLAATLCVRRSSRARPGMYLVLKLLQGDEEVTKWAKLQVGGLEYNDKLDEDADSSPSLQSHLNIALGDIDDSNSFSSVEQNVSLEDYLQGRWSRSSSFH